MEPQSLQNHESELLALSLKIMRWGPKAGVHPHCVSLFPNCSLLALTFCSH